MYFYRVTEEQFGDWEREVEAVGMHCTKGKSLDQKTPLVDRMEFRLPKLICLQGHCQSSEKVCLEEMIYHRLDEK